MLPSVRSCSRILTDSYYMQLPFMYAHAVYWGLQFIFMALACQAGITIAIFKASKSTGNANIYDHKIEVVKSGLWEIS